MPHYPDAMPESRRLFERARKVMPGGNNRTTDARGILSAIDDTFGEITSLS